MSPSQAQWKAIGAGRLALSCSLLKVRNDSSEFSAITFGWLSRECKNRRYVVRLLPTPGTTPPFIPPLPPTELCAVPGCFCAPPRPHASPAPPGLPLHPTTTPLRLHPHTS